MTESMKDLLRQYAGELQQIFEESLKAVILYGSYARGDFTEDSDVDIMILVDLPEDEIRKRREQVSDITYDFNMDHDMMIMPIVKEISQFRYWLSVHPFYRNVEREGVNLYVA